MGWLSALFFGQVQAAPFYIEAHRQAVQLLPAGEGQRWLDVGCGPGLVARLAAAAGYAVNGMDFDAAMVRRARSWAGDQKAPLKARPVFAVGSVFDLPAQVRRFDVVSAASLLAVLPERTAALRALLSALHPRGQALLIEPSEKMTRANATRYLAAHPGTRMAWVLRLWARTRSPGRAVTAADLRQPGWDVELHPLLGGLLNAWILKPSMRHKETS